jgi:hypothetical protein
MEMVRRKSGGKLFTWTANVQVLLGYCLGKARIEQEKKSMKAGPQGHKGESSNVENEIRGAQNSPNIRAKYTLAPLVEDGRKCLVCSDVEGMESVILESVEFYFGGTPWQRNIRKSDDIFGLIENEIFKWPALERITAARFGFWLNGERRARSFSIGPSLQPRQTSDRARLIIEDWLTKRGFIKVQNHDAKSMA